MGNCADVVRFLGRREAGDRFDIVLGYFSGYPLHLTVLLLGYR